MAAKTATAADTVTITENSPSMPVAGSVLPGTVDSFADGPRDNHPGAGTTRPGEVDTLGLKPTLYLMRAWSVTHSVYVEWWAVGIIDSTGAQAPASFGVINDIVWLEYQ